MVLRTAYPFLSVSCVVCCLLFPSARSPLLYDTLSSLLFPLLPQAFAFLELKTMELATAVLELDGIVYKETQLKMRRPSD